MVRAGPDAQLAGGAGGGGPRARGIPDPRLGVDYSLAAIDLRWVQRYALGTVRTRVRPPRLLQTKVLGKFIGLYETGVMPDTPTKPYCFVIGPIGESGSERRKHSDLLLQLVVKHVLEAGEFNYQVRRADEDSDPGMIGDRVIHDTINAELVVADLAELNPNVFYELGIRHSTEKPVIHIARDGTILPFDNKQHRTIFIDLSDWGSIVQGRQRVANFAQAIQKPSYRVSNPITQANASFKTRDSAGPRERIIVEMRERIARLEMQVNREGRCCMDPAGGPADRAAVGGSPPL
jgi:hypothetical protein